MPVEFFAMHGVQELLGLLSGFPGTAFAINFIQKSYCVRRALLHRVLLGKHNYKHVAYKECL